MNMKNIAFLLTAGLAAAGLATFLALGAGEHGGGAHGAAAPKAAAELTVPTVAVVKKTVPLYLDYVGMTEPIRTVTLQAKVTGYLAVQAVADGADVKTGDLIYRIDTRDYQAALDQAKAQVQRDRAALEYAVANNHRNSLLVRDGWVTKDAFDQNTSTLHQAEATLASDQAAREQAELNVGYTEIRAPFTGRLSRSLAHEGTLISAAGTPLNTLVQLDPIYATFNPAETDLTSIDKARAKGSVPVEIRTNDAHGPSPRGMLTFVDNTVDRSTGTITARATIPNPDLTLLPGQYIRARMNIGDLPDALLVPQAAVGSNQLGKFVYVVGARNTAEQHMVKLGPTYGELVVVSDGVKEGESIITGNLQKLGPGAAVQPKPADAQPGS
jgi:membrane fusion protein, multidrug efflux system